MTRHTDAVRRFVAFIQQTMGQRGMRCMRPELETALLELNADQLRQVVDAAESVSKGADGRSQLDLLAALRTVSARAARTALSRAGILYRTDVLLPLAAGNTTSAAFARNLALLQRQDAPAEERAAAQAALLAQCGPSSHEDLLPAATPSPAGAGNDGSAVSASPLEDEAGGARPRDARPEHEAGTRAPRRQVKVFAKASALTWETAPVRSQGGQGLTTVMIEGASARGDGTFDWSRKIVFACTVRELPRLLAVLMGWLSELEFNFHGGDPRKKLSLQHQPHGVHVRLQDASGSHSVPVEDADRYALAMLVLHAMVANEPLRDAQAVLAVCRDVMTTPQRLAVPAEQSQAGLSSSPPEARR